MSDTIGTRTRVAVTDRRRMPDRSDHVSTRRAWWNEAISYDNAYIRSSVGFLTYLGLDLPVSGAGINHCLTGTLWVTVVLVRGLPLFLFVGYRCSCSRVTIVLVRGLPL